MVEKVYPISSITSHSTFGDVCEWLKQMATYIWFQDSSFQEHQIKSFCRAITTNKFYELYSLSQSFVGSPPSALKSEEALKALLISGNDNPLSSLESMLQSVKQCCRGRSLFLTKEGVLGLSSKNNLPGDIIAVLLGCQFPLVLRSRSQGGYELLGKAYCNGFMDGKALLGPLPQLFAIRRRYDGTSGWYWNFLNQDTGLFQAEDPRLGSLLSGWSVKPHPADDFIQWIVNDATGESAFPDPRLTSEALRKRGIPLQEFLLI